MRFLAMGITSFAGQRVSSPRQGSSGGAEIVGLAQQTVKRFPRSGRGSVPGSPDGEGRHGGTGTRPGQAAGTATAVVGPVTQSGTDTPQRDPCSRSAITSASSLRRLWGWVYAGTSPAAEPPGAIPKLCNREGTPWEAWREKPPFIARLYCMKKRKKVLGDAKGQKNKSSGGCSSAVSSGGLAAIAPPALLPICVQ